MSDKLGVRVHFTDDYGNVVPVDYWNVTYTREKDGSLTIGGVFYTLAMFAEGVWKYVERLEGDGPDTEEVVIRE